MFVTFLLSYIFNVHAIEYPLVYMVSHFMSELNFVANEHLRQREREKERLFLSISLNVD